MTLGAPFAASVDGERLSNTGVSPRTRVGAQQVISVAEAAWLAGTLVVYAVVALGLISQGAPFGHDEAVYSLRARHLVQDAPPVFYWVAYRAPGLPFVLQVAWLGSATEPFLRLIAAAFGVPLIVSTWFVGRTLLGVRIGLIAAAGIAMTPTALVAATQVWPDVPGTALGMMAIAAYTWAITRPQASRWMLLVPVFVFAATMLRFGAPVPIAIGLVGITLWRWRTALASWPLIAMTALLTLVVAASVLYVPVVTGWAQLGDPITPASAIASAQSSSFGKWYSTITDYWEVRDRVLGGLAGGLALVGMTAGAVAALRRPSLRGGYVTAIGIAIATAASIAWLLHAETRYLSPALPWFWVASAVGLDALIPRIDRRVLAAVLVLGAVALVVDSYDRSDLQNDANSANYQLIEEAARWIDEASPDEGCSVLSSYVPPVGWYSHCTTRRIDIDEVVVDSAWFPDGPTYFFLVDGGKRQPDGEVLDGYMEVSTGPVFTVGDPEDGNRQYVEVYDVDE